MKTKTAFSPRRVTAFLASAWFFRALVALFVLQATWIALSGRYPMAFDEDFHLGIIRLYAHHISPFWSGQPAGADTYGAVARDPSYLYQYLMSFPYRLISVFTHDQTIQVLWLRAISIAMFASSLPLFRLVLLKTGASRAIIHACLLAFILIPVVPLLAAQINYDNMLIPLVGLVLLLVTNFNDELRKHKRVNTQLLLAIAILCLLSSLVKYAFLPIFAVIVFYLIIRLKQTFKHWTKAWQKLVAGGVRITRRTWVVLVLLLVLAGGLFGERYGINTLRYHTPVPDCSAVLSVQQCSAYGPWIRNYHYSLNNIDKGHNPLVFTADWFYGMWLRLFFAVDGPGTNFQTRGPFPVPGISAIVFAGLSVLLVIRYARRIFAVYDGMILALLATVTFFYVVLLWLDDYLAYIQVGQPVAINGRYLLPVMLPLLLFGALAFKEFFKRQAAGLQLTVAAIAIMSLLWGGGVLTYILRSNSGWYWPNAAVSSLNHAVQRTLGPLVPGYDHPTQFLGKN